jgi:hypothetical protein
MIPGGYPSGIVGKMRKNSFKWPSHFITLPPDTLNFFGWCFTTVIFFFFNKPYLIQRLFKFSSLGFRVFFYKKT